MNSIKVAVIFSLFLCLSADAEDFFKTTYSFKNLSLNYLNWSSRTKEESLQKDFTYLQLEAGAGFNWGSFYMFADIDNPTRDYAKEPMHNRRFVFKPIVDVKLFDTPWHIYTQSYNLKSKTFYVSNTIAGLSYKITDENLLFEPFLAPHYQQSSYYSGMNGYMFGWFLKYNFTLLGEKFFIMNWHEHEFKRAKANYLGEDGVPMGDGKSKGVQGSLSFWWHIHKHLTLGLQYRYADAKLGYDGYQNAVIYSIRHYF